MLRAPEKAADRGLIEVKNPTKLLEAKSREFRERYAELMTSHKETFPGVKTFRQPDIAELEAFQEALKVAPELHQLLTREIMTILTEIRNDEGEFCIKDDPLWSHQEALILEYVNMLTQKTHSGNPKKTMLMEEAPGAGKTRILGIILAAFRRLMARGKFDGNVLVLIKKRAMIPQQILSADARQARVQVLSENAKLEQYQYVQQLLCEGAEEFFPMKIWQELASQKYAKPAAAEEAIRATLKKRNKWKEFTRYPQHQDFLHEAGRLLSQHAGLVRDSNELDWQLIPMPPPGSKLEKGGGDYILWDGEEDQQNGSLRAWSEFIEGDQEPLNEATRIAVISRTALLQDSSRKKHAAFLSKVDQILVDEAGQTTGASFAQIVEDGGGSDPSVVAATAHNRRKRLFYDGYFSEVVAEELVNSKEDIMKPVRVRAFPGNTGRFFVSGSYEAAEQLVDAYGERAPLLDDLKKKQLQEGPHLVAVPPRLVSYIVDRLRQENEGSGITFVSYDANGSNEEWSSRIQLAMNSNEKICLVGSMAALLDSFDFRKLRSTWLGVQDDSKEMEFLKRAAGRQMHSKEEGTIVQQRFSTSPSPNYNVWNAYRPDCTLPEEGETTLVPGQILLGREAFRREMKATMAAQKSGTKIWSHIGKPAFKREAELMEGGTFPDMVTAQRAHATKRRLIFPKLDAASTHSSFSAAYIEEFAQRNVIKEHLAELKEAVKKRSKNTTPYEALKSAAERCKLIKVRDTATKARANMRALIHRHTKVRQYVRTVRPDTPKPEKKEPSGASYAANVLRQVGEAGPKKSNGETRKSSYDRYAAALAADEDTFSDSPREDERDLDDLLRDF